MTRLCLFVFALFFSLLQPAFAGGAPAPQSTFNWEESSIPDLATRFAMSVGDDQFDIAYNSAGDVLRDLRSLDEFTEDMKTAHFDQITSVKWDSAIPALPANGGFKLRGEATLDNGKTIPVYMHVQGDAHVDPETRNRKWNQDTQWTVMDLSLIHI